MTDAQLKKIFAIKTIAAVGLSSNAARPSYGVCSYLQGRGYRIIPVNPNETEVLGEKAYPDLDAVPGPVEIVQIFRRPEAVPEIVEAAIRKGAQVVWMQDGAGNPDAARRAEAAGLLVVADDCMLRQHRRLFGE
ncbi:MAG: CoA-binding protein [Patescibacteria group bacterium]